MEEIKPLTYLKSIIEQRGIKTHVLCDGEVLYDCQVHKSFESVTCPFIDEIGSHFLFRSPAINGKRLVLMAQPDFDRVLENSPEGVPVVDSVYIIKVIDDDDCAHTSDGHRLIKVRPDGSIVQIHPENGGPSTQDYQRWIDYVVESLFE